MGGRAARRRHHHPAGHRFGLLHGCITAVKESVLKAYPSHELTAVGDWMLLAAIEALIDEQDYLANYHLAWYAVTTRRGGSRGFAA